MTGCGPGPLTLAEASALMEISVAPKRSTAPGAMRLSPQRTLIAFDVFFFSTFAIGWILTAAFNPAFIKDNGITRVFGVYNICMGIDSLPARWVAIPLSYCTSFFFMLTVILSMHKIFFRDVGRFQFKVLRASTLFLALPCGLLFSWSIGIPYGPPMDPVGLTKHVQGFAVGLVGYSLLKLSSLLELAHEQVTWRASCSSWRYVAFITIESLTCVFLFLFGINMLYVMSSKGQTLEDTMSHPFRGTVGFDWIGLPLIIVTAASPPLACLVEPRRRTVSIEVNYGLVIQRRAESEPVSASRSPLPTAPGAEPDDEKV